MAFCFFSRRQRRSQGVDRFVPLLAFPSSKTHTTQDSVEGQLLRSLPVSPLNLPSPLEHRQNEDAGAGSRDGESQAIETSRRSSVTPGHQKSSFQVRAAKWKGRPIIFLKNASSSHLSYWVIEEDRLETKSVQEKVTTRIEASMNLGVGGSGLCSIHSGTGVGLGGSKEKETAIEREAVGYCLSRDQRVAPYLGGVGCRSEQAGTQVMFPRDCKRLRVIGFFRKHKGQPWRRFKDKVYLNDRAATIYTIRPTDATLDEYVDEEVTNGECVIYDLL